MPTHGGIEWAYVGPVTETWDGESQSISYGAKVAWDDRRAWRAAMVGYATYTAPNLLLTRQLPYLYPEDPELVCTRVEVSDPKGVFVHDAANEFIEHRYRAAGGAPTREGDAFYRVAMSAVLWQVLPDDEVDSELQRFCIQRKRASAEAQRVPRGMWKWTDTGKLLQEESAYPVVLTQLSLTLLQLPKEPPRLAATINCVNSDVWVGPDGVSYGIGTLLMEPPTVEPKTGPNLLPSFEMTVVMLHRASGWNNQLRMGPTGGGPPATGYYPLEAADGSGRRPYAPAAFTPVFANWTP